MVGNKSRVAAVMAGASRSRQLSSSLMTTTTTTRPSNVVACFSSSSSSSSNSKISSYLNDPSLLTMPPIPSSSSSSSTEEDNIIDTFQVVNPSNPSHIISNNVPIMNCSHVKTIIDQSYECLSDWKDGSTTAQYRSSLLTKWSQLIQSNKDDIATIMTLESGKVKQESIGEVNYGTSFLDYYAAEAIRPNSAGGGFISPTTFASPDDGNKPRGQIMSYQEGIGVTGLITPWNFPIAMITRKVGPALAAGCTAIVKPSELTPLTAVALQNLALQAGIPENVVQLVTTDKARTPEVGDELCTNPLVKKISFTGSTNVGKLLMKTSSETMKKLSLELGGNAPFIVFNDADVDQAVSAAMNSKFRNAGQTCVCADRFLIQSGVYDEFITKLTQKVSEINVGDGLQDGVTMGPLISENACNNVHTKVQEAVGEGASCVIGGNKIDTLGSNNFYEPTILTNVSTSSKIWYTETFGPVMAIRKFDLEEEAIQIANDCNVGLASYFCTTNLSRAYRVSKKIEAGIVGVNDGIISSASAPFGGIKESGLGREGSALGLNEYLQTKYVFMNY